MRNEQTSPRVAAIAARVMGMSDDKILEMDPADVRTLAASCLTQAPSKLSWLPWRKG